MIISVDKQKVLKEFKDKYVDQFIEEDVSKIFEVFKENQQVIKNEIILKFKENCRKAENLMKNNLKGKIKYIYISFLRTGILENKGLWRIDFLDEKWFMDKEECSENIDLSCFYEELFKYCNELMEKKKQYGRAITEMDVEEIKMAEADKYHIEIIKIFKNIINEILETEEYKNLNKDEEIKIFTGEYMDKTVLLYDNSKKKSGEE